MSVAVPVRSATGEVFLGRLAQVCEQHERHDTATQLVRVRELLAGELEEVEARLARITTTLTPVGRAVAHTLGSTGKRLRPTCVALAARAGKGLSAEHHELAVAVELVHAATLLHDDVVDLGDLRRGRPTARVVFGNAASIFGGDWLLVDALRRIERSGVGGLLERMLFTLTEMLEAESLQLEARSQIAREVSAPDRATVTDRLTAVVSARDRSTYFRIVEGKTAALFGWAMAAGARAGGCSPEVVTALEGYGREMGIAFQIVDDVLDISGDAATFGKSVLGDVREGMLTHPVLVALEREPNIAALLATATVEAELPPAFAESFASAVSRTGAVAASLEVAQDFSRRATANLCVLPDGPARGALEALAAAALYRTR